MKEMNASLSLHIGVYCETNVDECAADPCVNGGVCEDGLGEFFCLCPAGFSGIISDVTHYIQNIYIF